MNEKVDVNRDYFKPALIGLILAYVAVLSVFERVEQLEKRVIVLENILSKK